MPTRTPTLRPASLAADYEACRRLNAQHGKTYYFSTLFFPPLLRRQVHALYGFVRYPDELVDNPALGIDPVRALADYRADTLHALQTGQSDLPVLRAFADMARQVGMTADYPLAFLDAMAMDLTRTRYQTFDDLLCYTYGSASVVGLMMCCLFGVEGEDTLHHAYDLGLAMQLTNFWRDIGEDYHLRGRIYLPREDMDQFGYTEAMLAEGIVNHQFRALLAFEIARARDCYASADKGIPQLPLPAQRPVRLARVLYSRILDKIEDADYDVFRRRVRTSALEKVAEAARQQFSPARSSHNHDAYSRNSD